MRLSSVSHSDNMNQRFMELPKLPSSNPAAGGFAAVAGGLSVTVPVNPNHVPPGHYMMFFISTKGVPSVAEVVRIG